MNDTLLVPIKLACLVINHGATHAVNNRSIRRFQYKYSNLKEFNSAEPSYFSGPTIINQFNIENHLGVFVKWELPAGLRHNVAIENASTATDFPPVPTRWLVVRTYGNINKREYKAWIVESNYQDPSRKEGSLFLDPTGKGTLLGSCIELSKWDKNSETKDPSRYIDKLTAVSSGDPTFSIYQPYNNQVFSFHDTLNGIDKDDKLSYFVCGWYANPNQDPIALLKSSFSKLQDQKCGWDQYVKEKLQQKYFWQIATDTTTNDLQRILCHGLSVAVDWDSSKELTELPKSKQDQKDPRELQISIGYTGLDALSTLLNNYSKAAIPPIIFDVLSRGLLKKLQKIDSEEELRKQQHEEGFAAEPGGIYWEIIINQTQSDTNPNAYNDNLNNLPENITILLDDLNCSQVNLEEEERLLQGNQWNLYALWWKQGRIPYVDNFENKKDILNKLSKHLDPNQEDGLYKEVENLKNRLSDLQQTIQEKKAKLEEEIDKIQPSYKLKFTPKSSFWKPVSPVILLTGIDPGALIEQKQNLICRTTQNVVTNVDYKDPEGIAKSKNSDDIDIPEDLSLFFKQIEDAEIIWKEFSILDYVLSNGGIEIKSIPEQTLPPFGISGWIQPWDPLFMEWEIEWCKTEFSDWTFNGLQYVLNPQTEIREEPSDTISGRIFLNAHACFSFKEHLKKLIEAYPEIAKEYKEINTHDWEQQFSSWDLLSQRLSGLEEYFTLRDIKMNRFPKSEDPITKLLDVKNNYTVPLPGSYQKPYLFKPIRQGQFFIRRLSIMDNFGQSVDVISPTITSKPLFVSNSLIPKKSIITVENKIIDINQIIELSPRIGQSFRLNCRWVGEYNQQVNPICGWILPNYIDQSLQFYTPVGDYLGEISKNSSGCIWEFNPQGLELPKVCSSFPRLGNIISIITGNDNDFEFKNIIEQALSFKSSPKIDNEHCYAAYFGRPLALATAKWNFELRLPYYQNQTWNALEYQLSLIDDKKSQLQPLNINETLISSMKENSPELILAKTEFKLRLGDPSLVGDGLIGYFKEGFENFYSVYPKESENTYIKIITGDELQITLEANSVVTTTLLLDPILPVHAYCALVPFTPVILPPRFIQVALNKMAIPFKIGPVLSLYSNKAEEENSSENLSIVMPKPSLGKFIWLEPTAAPNVLRSLEIRAADHVARFLLDPYDLVEGWLSISMQEMTNNVPKSKKSSNLGQIKSQQAFKWQHSKDKNIIKILLNTLQEDKDKADTAYLSAKNSLDNRNEGAASKYLREAKEHYKNILFRYKAGSISDSMCECTLVDIEKIENRLSKIKKVRGCIKAPTKLKLQ